MLVNQEAAVVERVAFRDKRGRWRAVWLHSVFESEEFLVGIEAAEGRHWVNGEVVHGHVHVIERALLLSREVLDAA